MDTRTTQLAPESYYHIYNRGVNGQSVFFASKNYDYFLQQYARYVHPWVRTYAYCLLNNHFHLLIQVKSEEELSAVMLKDKDKPSYWHVSNGFSSFLQGYTRAINKHYDRTGPLFERPFKRIAVTNNAYFSQLIRYIHHNPVKHGFVTDHKEYPYSSYHAHLATTSTKLYRREVLDWFGGKENYASFHEETAVLPLDTDWFWE
ncbi:MULTISPECIES: transposase [Reichenbachiella]|uniref:Transposase IS200 like n=1 Tax=Reichenbachiella agariperforans TaxID=156994 RepID=A0A1M6SMI3_REIAG|nr:MULTISPECIES: transposase [Reichenbachiella]RJE75044.1 hypothetical protein BGP76_18195 [Reichenbachiella sp. MSK19-1]SHK45846.1 Transposase IS200 like [Reichenbachiella agariperforans]